MVGVGLVAGVDVQPLRGCEFATASMGLATWGLCVYSQFSDKHHLELPGFDRHDIAQCLPGHIAEELNETKSLPYADSRARSSPGP